MRLASIFRRKSPDDPVVHLYADLVAEARRPAYYRDLGVPDSLDGRFEMIAVTVFLAMRRLKRATGASAGLAQRLFDHMFADMDRSLREIGVSDLVVGDRVKEMARGFFGRVVAYEAGLDGPDAVLLEALRRNLYGTVQPAEAAVAAMAAHLRMLDLRLAALDPDRLAAGGSIDWPVPAVYTGIPLS